MYRLDQFLTQKNDFESTNFEMFEEVVHNFGKSDNRFHTFIHVLEGQEKIKIYSLVVKCRRFHQVLILSKYTGQCSASYLCILKSETC